MAGDWIKVEHVTPDKPEIYAIASILGIDPDAVVGKIIRVWIWADQHSKNGQDRHGAFMAIFDKITGVDGFASAMQKVGWLDELKGGR